MVVLVLMTVRAVMVMPESFGRGGSADESSKGESLFHFGIFFLIIFQLSTFLYAYRKRFYGFVVKTAETLNYTVI